MNTDDIIRSLPRGHSEYLSLSSIVTQLASPTLFLGDPDNQPRSPGLYVVYHNGQPYTICECYVTCCAGLWWSFARREGEYQKNTQSSVTFRKLVFLQPQTAG
jgi:hypothetical protein